MMTTMMTIRMMMMMAMEEPTITEKEPSLQSDHDQGRRKKCSHFIRFLRTSNLYLIDTIEKIGWPLVGGFDSINMVNIYVCLICKIKLRDREFEDV